jgi:hypothetical protein
MQDAFATLVWVVAGAGVVVALITLAGTARQYREIGGSGLTHDSDGPADTSAGAAAERDEEIRQMLDARNARRERRGETPVDVDAELAALTHPTPAADPALREEVRELVVARNHRRVRAGKEPLDVEAEVQRRIRELT